MIYRFFHTILQPAIRAWFKRVYLTNVERIPASNPVMFACNHPSSAMDGILLALMLRRPLHFLARSDVFNAPWKRKFLGAIHLLPIYRMQEGYENLTKNDDTFSECFDLFRRNGTIIIFPEGFNVHEKRLRPLKKGAAKLALQAQEAISQDLYIVPVGINYTDAPYPRTEVMVNFGEPILVKEYMNLYQEAKPKAITQLTRQLAEHIAPEVIHQNHGTEPLAEHCLTLRRPHWDWSGGDIARLRAEQQICQQVNQLYQENPALYQSLLGEADAYQAALDKAYVTDLQVVRSQQPTAWLWWLLRMVGLPLTWLGKAVNFLPLYLAHRLTIQKVKLVEFVATVRFVASAVFYLLYLLVLLDISACFGWLWVVGLLALLSVSGFLGMWLNEIPVSWNSLQQGKTLMQHRDRLVSQLMKVLPLP
ncbi:MAG: 1-acyl-sn-glycerol-3-phosphate acyltransferase [Spirosomataceae bacterium]